jgi:GNAT superfamily N-acetyltransferase
MFASSATGREEICGAKRVPSIDRLRAWLTGRSRVHRAKPDYHLRLLCGTEHLGHFAQALANLRRQSLIEEWPVSTPPSVDVLACRITLVVTSNDCLWLAEDKAAAPLGSTLLRPLHRRPGEAVLQLYVRPCSRRQGVGRALLRASLAQARRSGAALLHLRTLSCVPPGEAFAASVGAVPSRRLLKSEARIDEFWPDLTGLSATLAERELTFHTFIGGLPTEAIVRDVAALRQQVAARYRTAPAWVSLEELTRTLPHQQKMLEGLGLEQWSVCALARSGRCVGYSEYLWDPEEPDVIAHADLGIAEDYRGGRLLERLIATGRAAVCHAHPSVSWVRRTRQIRRGAEIRPSAAAQDRSFHVETRWHLTTDTPKL